MKHKFFLITFLLILTFFNSYTQEDEDFSDEESQAPQADFTDEQMAEFDETGTVLDFQADVARLMDIIINSLYTNKEVFLRELISNGSDALDKLRFLALSDPDLMKDSPDLKIMLEYDAEEKTLSITDTGIGMTKNELIKNLGTVAKSGTAAFVEAMTKGDSSNLIGQFGVGFYSSYLVSKKVVVTSKSTKDDQYIWISQAGSSFTVLKDPRGNTLKRGTKVTLFLKEDAVEFADQETIKKVAKKFSEFINYPMYLYTQKQVTKQHEEDVIPEPREDGEELEISEEEDMGREKKIVAEKVTVWDWELINENKAIWLRDKKDISEEEYIQFYKAMTKDNEDPLTFSHVKAEGEIEFKSILFIPASAPYDLFDNYYGRNSAIRLYVKRILITEEFEELMPRYLNFVKGVLDSDDLPLNISREQLQQLKLVKVISKKMVRKVINMINALAQSDDDEDDEEEDEEGEEEDEEEEEDESEEDSDEEKEEVEGDSKYEKFWKQYGKNIKLGVIEDPSNRTKLAKLLRFYSTKSMDKLISLDDYIKRKQPKQDVIYFLPGENKDILNKSPLIQKLKAHEIEVLLLDDPIDEFCIQNLSEYEQMKVLSAAKGDIKLDNSKLQKKKEKKLKEIFKPLTKWWKQLLDKRVEKIEVSNRLTDTPCAISTSEYGYSANQERINRAQAFSNPEKAQSYMLARKTLEINPSHPLIKKLLAKVEEAGDDDVDENVRTLALVMFETALLNSGFDLDDNITYAEKVEKLLRAGIGISADEPVQEIELQIEDEDDEDESAEDDEEEYEDETNYAIPPQDEDDVIRDEL